MHLASQPSLDTVQQLALPLAHLDRVDGVIGGDLLHDLLPAVSVAHIDCAAAVPAPVVFRPPTPPVGPAHGCCSGGDLAAAPAPAVQAGSVRSPAAMPGQ